MRNELVDFIVKYESKVAELEKQCCLANYNASLSGKPEDFEKSAALELEYNKNICQ